MLTLNKCYHPFQVVISPDSVRHCLLKYRISLSCFSAASRVGNVPRFLRFPVLGFFFREYMRYSPVLSFLIIF